MIIGRYYSRNGLLERTKNKNQSFGEIIKSYDGVYETLKIEDDTLLFPEAHIQRFKKSADSLGIRLEDICWYNDNSHRGRYQSPKSLCEKIEYHMRDFASFVAAYEELKTFNVCMVLVRNKHGSGDIYFFAVEGLKIPEGAYSDGVNVVTQMGSRTAPHAKTLGEAHKLEPLYLTAKKCGLYDVLLVNENGFVTEGTKTNLFFVDKNEVYTPPHSNALFGVTKRTLIHALAEKGIEVKERVLAKEDLDNYDGYFLTSTSSKVIPIRMVDGRKFDVPEPVRKIMNIYDGFLDIYKRNSSKLVFEKMPDSSIVVPIIFNFLVYGFLGFLVSAYNSAIAFECVPHIKSPIFTIKQ